MRRVTTHSALSPPFIADFEQAMHRLAGFEARPHLAIAVSGGADSMALVLAAQYWAVARGGKVTALVVDHGLRAESQAEAKQVEAWLKTRGIDVHILTLQLDREESAIQERARNARYAALMRWCCDHYALHLLVGHHQGDQAETFLFRLIRGSGLTGLAAMSPVREMMGVRILRPLLEMNKEDCKAYLQNEQQPWIEDPSNDDLRYSRTQFRHLLARQPSSSIRRLMDVMKGLAQHRRESDGQLAGLLVQHVMLYPEGYAVVSGIDEEVAMWQPLFQAVLMSVNGGVTMPRSGDVQRLVNALHREGGARRTLHGCVIERSCEGQWLIYRELKRMAGAVAPDRARVQWDRFTCYLSAPLTEGYRLGALGEVGWSHIKGKCSIPDHLTKPIVKTLPAIWRLEEPVYVPHIGYDLNDWGDCRVKLIFSPAKALAGASFSAMNEARE